MLITRDMQTGKLIVDFDGDAVVVKFGRDVSPDVFPTLFDPDVVCTVRNGTWDAGGQKTCPSTSSGWEFLVLL